MARWPRMNLSAVLDSWELKMLVFYLVLQTIMGYYMCLPCSDFIATTVSVHWLKVMSVVWKKGQVLTKCFFPKLGLLLLTLTASALVTTCLCYLMQYVSMATINSNADSNVPLILLEVFFLLLALVVFSKAVSCLSIWLSSRQTGCSRPKRPGRYQCLLLPKSRLGLGLKKSLQGICNRAQHVVTNLWNPPRPPIPTKTKNSPPFKRHKFSKETVVDSSDTSDTVMILPPKPFSRWGRYQRSDSSTSLDDDYH